MLLSPENTHMILHVATAMTVAMLIATALACIRKQISPRQDQATGRFWIQALSALLIRNLATPVLADLRNYSATSEPA
jgi:hypothetical protein